jgi:arylformamidase
MKFNSIIDISWPIGQNMTEYKDRNSLKLETYAHFERDRYCQSRLAFDTHTGTHVDAPAHFPSKTSTTIDGISLEKLVGPCTVYDMTACQQKITQADLVALSINAGEIVLFKTKNSQAAVTAPFNNEFIYIAQDAAEYLVAQDIKGVGIDYPGIERNQPGHGTHTKLFDASISIIEGLRLGHVQAGHYFFCCLPLALQGLEAAPARAVLFS